MANIEKHTTITYELQLSEFEANGLALLLNYGVIDTALRELGLLDLLDAFNSSVVTNSVEFTHVAQLA